MERCQTMCSICRNPRCTYSWTKDKWKIREDLDWMYIGIQATPMELEAIEMLNYQTALGLEIAKVFGISPQVFCIGGIKTCIQ
jgi:hypothetical protein